MAVSYTPHQTIQERIDKLQHMADGAAENCINLAATDLEIILDTIRRQIAMLEKRQEELKHLPTTALERVIKAVSPATRVPVSVLSYEDVWSVVQELSETRNKLTVAQRDQARLRAELENGDKVVKCENGLVYTGPMVDELRRIVKDHENVIRSLAKKATEVPEVGRVIRCQDGSEWNAAQVQGLRDMANCDGFKFLKIKEICNGKLLNNFNNSPTTSRW